MFFFSAFAVTVTVIQRDYNGLADACRETTLLPAEKLARDQSAS